VEMTDNVEANKAIAALNGAESGGRSLIFSDEGFSVGIQDRSHMIYESHGKKMTIAGELGSNGFAAYLCNMKTWDDRTPVAASEREQIINNIKQAFASQRQVVDFD